MTFKVILVYNGEEFPITSSKAELVKDFQKKVFEATKVKPSLQQLLFQGKFLSAKNQATFNNYRIDDGYKVQLFARNPLQDVPKNNNGNASDINENSSGKELAPPSPPPVFEEREPDEPALNNSANNDSNDDLNLSQEERKKRLLELGLDENALAEIEKEESQAQEEPAPQVCNRCKKKPGRVCRECNCRECGVPERDEVALFCEECQYVTHIYCVDPPINESKGKDSDWKEEMDALPDEWYCPHCKRYVELPQIILS